ILCGAQAVNAYVDDPRMTQDVDILSRRAADLADEIRTYLRQRFQIAVRVGNVARGNGYGIHQVRKLENRHLVDVRQVDPLPPSQRIEKLLVLTPVELIVSKLLSMASRAKTAKGAIDR